MRKHTFVIQPYPSTDIWFTAYISIRRILRILNENRGIRIIKMVKSYWLKYISSSQYNGEGTSLDRHYMNYNKLSRLAYSISVFNYKAFFKKLFALFLTVFYFLLWKLVWCVSLFPYSWFLCLFNYISIWSLSYIYQ